MYKSQNKVYCKYRFRHVILCGVDMNFSNNSFAVADIARTLMSVSIILQPGDNCSATGATDNGCRWAQFIKWRCGSRWKMHVSLAEYQTKVGRIVCDETSRPT